MVDCGRTVELRDPRGVESATPRSCDFGDPPTCFVEIDDLGVVLRPGLRQYRDMQMDKDVCSKSRTEARGSEARRHGRCKCEIGQGKSSQLVEGPRRDPTVQG